MAVLFARADSVYKTIQGCDVWDAERDARKWPVGAPVVAHPPCRAWGTLRAFAKPRPDEKQLGMFAVCQVQRFGGVLEHPQASSLWRAACLPRPGEVDDLGGFTLPISQFWFGHRAEKRTWLYVVGCAPSDVPPIQYRLGEASHVVSPARGIRAGHPKYRPQLRKAEREHTPIDLARFLVELARRARVDRAY